MNTYTGTIKSKSEIIKVSEKFSKRDFVVVDNGQYPKPIAFQVSQDRVSLLDAVKIGDEVTVHYNLRGREWKDPKKPEADAKHFNTLDVFKIEMITKTAATKTPNPF